MNTKGNALKLVAATGLALASAAVAPAADFVMTNAVDRAPAYQTAANYLGGAAPNYKTSDGRTDAVYATNRIDFAQTLTFTAWNPTSNSTVYGGTLHGDAYRQFCNSIGYNNRILLLTDLADWPGLVYHETGNMFLSLSPGEGATATLPLVSLERAARVGIVDANAELTVGRSIGRGVHTLNEKANATSPGRITLEEPLHGPSASLTVKAGDIRIAGAPTETPGVVGDPVLHLDASAGDTAFETTADADKSYVERWYDRRGREGHPSAYASDAQKKPFLATDPDSGRRVIDFGASLFDAGDPINQFLDGVSIGYSGYSGVTLGKVGFLEFSESIEGIREVFVVLREATDLNGIAPFLGDTAGEPQAFARGFVRNQPLYSARTPLFGSGAETDGLKLGDVRIDGYGVRYDVSDDLSREFHVLSVGLAIPAKARYVGTNGKTVCKNGATGYTRGFAIGGFKLAEMIVYTNALTGAERAEVNRYLRQKWQPAGGSRDLAFGEFQPAAGKSVDVPSGELRVGKLSVTAGTTLVKKGEGALTTTLATTNAFSLAVEGGEVSFGKPTTLPSDDPQPAADPDTWFRADVEDSMTLGEADENGCQTVTVWNHCENGGTNAFGIASRLVKFSNLSGFAGVDPVRCFDSELNAYVVDLGDYSESVVDGMNSSCLRTRMLRSDGVWQEPSTCGKVRTGFIVCRPSHAKASIIASSGSAIFRDEYGNGNLLSGHAANLYGDYFAMDGVRISPSSTRIPSDEWHLISFRLATEQMLEMIGSQWGKSAWGGLRVAERLQYSRELTDEEFRETEAYLLKKYLGKTHPDVETAAAPVRLTELTIEEGATPRVASDRDLEVGTLVSAGASFEKAGSGAMALSALPTNVRDVSVSGGSLTAGVDWLADAFLHVDASDDSTVVCADGSNQVERWYDVRGNGLYAQSKTGTFKAGQEDYAPATYETASDTVGTNLVAGSRFVDFGTLAGMTWGRDGQTSAVTTSTLREMHMVFCMMAKGNYVPVGHTSYEDLVPGGLSRLYYLGQFAPVAGFSPMLTDDGGWQPNARFLSTGKEIDTNRFYVVSLSLTNNVSASTFGIDRTNCGRGNIRLCEVILFNDATNTLERCEAIHNHLMRKWLGKGEQRPLPVSFDSISVSDGATLALDVADGSDVTAGSLTGDGTLDVGTLTVDTDEGISLARRFDEAGTLACLEALGTLTLPAAGQVVLTSAAGIRPDEGYYPILKADTLKGIDPTQWTLDVTGAWPKRGYGLVFKENEVGIKVQKLGLAVIIR